MSKRPDPIRGMMNNRRADEPRTYSDAEIQGLLEELEQLRALMMAQRQQVDSLEEHAMADPLTGLANRRTLESELEKSLATSRRYGRQHALLVIEIDAYGTLAERLGQETAETMLTHTARMLRQNIRPTDIAARLENATFAVILNELRSLENAATRASELSRIISETPCISRMHTLHITATVGHTGFGPEDAVQDIIARATNPQNHSQAETD
jgi:diguanylate cyclase